MASQLPPNSTADYNFLKFEILGIGDTISLPALIINTQARMEAQWDEFSEIGRADPKVLLAKFSKTIDLDFLVVATGGDRGVEQTLSDLERLSKVVTPNYNVASGEGYQGVFIKLSYGGLYREQVFYVNSLGYTWDNENITWYNVDSGATALPILTKVNMTLQYVGRRIPSTQVKFFQ